ncbi:MAG: pilus assembly protein [Proteobacteria bacterium]|nr:pilus assembly protein [Pseudomonadota bacterium]
MTIPSRNRRVQRRGRERGMTMVEFVIAIPVALLVVFGIVQIGLMYSAKAIVNEGTFVAARAGAFQNAQLDVMTQAMTKSLIPFYQDTTNTNAITRLSEALLHAKLDAEFLHVELQNPSPAVFEDFGIAGSGADGHTFIPNDNMEIRDRNYKGPKSGLTIQDANTLKLKVIYGYEMKVPLMKSVIGAIMCGIDNGVKGFGSGNTANVVGGDDCTNYYSKGRIPLIAYATVQMQTPAWQAEAN